MKEKDFSRAGVAELTWAEACAGEAVGVNDELVTYTGSPPVSSVSTVHALLPPSARPTGEHVTLACVAVPVWQVGQRVREHIVGVHQHMIIQPVRWFTLSRHQHVHTHTHLSR